MQNSIEELRSATAAKEKPAPKLVKVFSIHKPAAEYYTWTYNFELHNGAKVSFGGVISHRYITKFLNFAAMREFSGGEATISSQYVEPHNNGDYTHRFGATMVADSRLELTVLERYHLGEEIYSAIKEDGQVTTTPGIACMEYAGQKWEIDFRTGIDIPEDANPCILKEWKGYKN